VTIFFGPIPSLARPGSSMGPAVSSSPVRKEGRDKVLGPFIEGREMYDEGLRKILYSIAQSLAVQSGPDKSEGGGSRSTSRSPGVVHAVDGLAEEVDRLSDVVKELAGEVESLRGELCGAVHQVARAIED
jgi:hypothetical protein